MYYIILDLEWDSGYHPKYKRFLNQILQIGAVKLNEDLKVTDTFELTVRSSFTKRVTGRFAALTGITTQQMLSGVSLQDAVERYNQWVGEDTVTMSWSTSDLFAILENEKYLLEGKHFRLEKYLDLQEYIQNEMRLSGMECNSQISLADAAAVFRIPTEQFDLHTAKDDSMLCVALLQKEFCRERFEGLIKDTANPEFYRRLCFKPYYIDNISNPEIDRTQLKFRCEQCGHDAKRTSGWRYRNRWFFANFHCNGCSEDFSGRVSFRKMYDTIVVKKRICAPKEQKKEVVNDEMQSVPADVRQ